MESQDIQNRSLEQLEGEKWGEVPACASGLVRSVHTLRKEPIASLTAWQLSRLIGQNVGLKWLIPVALDILHSTAPEQAAGGFYDDDLLTAVLSSDRSVWRKNPEWTQRMREILDILQGLDSDIQEDVGRFLSDLSD